MTSSKNDYWQLMYEKISFMSRVLIAFRIFFHLNLYMWLHSIFFISFRCQKCLSSIIQKQWRNGNFISTEIYRPQHSSSGGAQVAVPFSILTKLTSVPTCLFLFRKHWSREMATKRHPILSAITPAVIKIENTHSERQTDLLHSTQSPLSW